MNTESTIIAANPTFIRLPELTRMIGLSKTTIYDKINKGTFPKPHKISSRCVGWRYQCILDWSSTCPESDQS